MQQQTSSPCGSNFMASQHPSPLPVPQHQPSYQQHASTQPSFQSPASHQQSMVMAGINVNMVTVCRMGQEMVHDVVSKAQEIFQLLSAKNVQLNINSLQHQERMAKLEENLAHVGQQFRKLHTVYYDVQQLTTPPANLISPRLIPECGGVEQPAVADESAGIDMLVSGGKVVEHYHEIVKVIQSKNRELKEIIDQLRNIIWEMNTMITMR